MSGLFKQFKTNEALEVEGVKIEFHEAINEDGTVPTFIISRMGKANKAYTKAFEAATRPYRRQIELSTMKNEVADKLLQSVFIDTVLKGWENIRDEDNKELEFNKENALFILKALPDVYDRLQEEAKISSNFRDEMLETESKN